MRFFTLLGPQTSPYTNSKSYVHNTGFQLYRRNKVSVLDRYTGASDKNRWFTHITACVLPGTVLRALRLIFLCVRQMRQMNTCYLMSYAASYHLKHPHLSQVAHDSIRLTCGSPAGVTRGSLADHRRVTGGPPMDHPRVNRGSTVGHAWVTRGLPMAGLK